MKNVNPIYEMWIRVPPVEICWSTVSLVVKEKKKSIKDYSENPEEIYEPPVRVRGKSSYKKCKGFLLIKWFLVEILPKIILSAIMCHIQDNQVISPS